MDKFVFVSHSHKDSHYVQKLCEFLQQEGISAWYDQRIATGERWDREIRKRLERCAAVVVVMTPSAEDSSWVAEELHHARSLGKPLVPLLLAGTPFFGLRGTQYFDVSNGELPTKEFVDAVRRATDSVGTPGHIIACLRSSPTVAAELALQAAHRGLAWLESLPVKWGPTPTSSPRTANLAEGLLALGAARRVLTVPESTYVLDCVSELLALQREDGGFVSVTIDVVTPHPHSLATLALTQWAEVDERIPKAIDEATAWLRNTTLLTDNGWRRYAEDTAPSVVPSLWAFLALLNADRFPADVWANFRDELLSAGTIGDRFASRQRSIAASGWALMLLNQMRQRNLFSSAEESLAALALDHLANTESVAHFETEVLWYTSPGGHAAWRSWLHPTAAATVLGAIPWLPENDSVLPAVGHAIGTLLQHEKIGEGRFADSNLEREGAEPFTFPTMYGVWALSEVAQRLGPTTYINKLGLVILDGTRVLLLRKRGQRLLILPGGGAESADADELATLSREAREEVNADVVNPVFWREFEDVAAFEANTRVRIRAYCAELTQSPTASGEIAEIVWFDVAADPDDQLSPILRNLVIPALRTRLSRE